MIALVISIGAWIIDLRYRQNGGDKPSAKAKRIFRWSIFVWLAITAIVLPHVLHIRPGKISTLLLVGFFAGWEIYRRNVRNQTRIVLPA
jgi:hypothetical protein